MRLCFQRYARTPHEDRSYDGDNLVEETNPSGAAVARYSQGLNIDEPLAMLRSATTSYFQADGLGSVTSLTNTSGANSQIYDSFGNLTASTGSLTNSFRCTGREFDAETSPYYYRARYYDPQAGICEPPEQLQGAQGMGGQRTSGERHVILLKEAQARFAGHQFEELYEKWLRGAITDAELAQIVEQTRPSGTSVFRTMRCGSSLSLFTDPRGNGRENSAEEDIAQTTAKISTNRSIELSGT